MATPRQFLSSQRLGEHGYIRAIVRGRTVLVTGYSGTGDVDILPHLQAAHDEDGTTFVWLRSPTGQSELHRFVKLHVPIRPEVGGTRRELADRIRSLQRLANANGRLPCQPARSSGRG